ncbi:MAG: tyrosine-type recombinase/integrase [Chloroflexi bacterium]|nr:tyrosine-type recombinase/integrase [Chloroflexota bacterium]
MSLTVTDKYAPDALHTLRESFSLHLDATRKPKTSTIYLAALDALIAHLAVNGMPTAARGVRRDHVESYIAKRRAVVKPTTLSVEFRALQQFFKRALEEEEIDRSPMEKMKAPKVDEAPVPVVALDDFRKLLKACDGRDYQDRRDAAILLVLFDTGVRLGELTAMTIEDVDLRAGLAFVTGKTGTRAVRFGSKTAVALDRYLRLRRGHRLADAPAFWLGQDGPMSSSGLAQVIARRCVAAGLPRLHPHQFRHTFAHEPRDGEVPVQAADEQRRLEEEHHRGPRGRSSAEDRQHEPSVERLDAEQEERGQADR